MWLIYLILAVGVLVAFVIVQLGFIDNWYGVFMMFSVLVLALSIGDENSGGAIFLSVIVGVGALIAYCTKYIKEVDGGRQIKYINCSAGVTPLIAILAIAFFVGYIYFYFADIYAITTYNIESLPYSDEFKATRYEIFNSTINAYKLPRNVCFVSSVPAFAVFLFRSFNNGNISRNFRKGNAKRQTVSHD
jgi:hypothetical protein